MKVGLDGTPLLGQPTGVGRHVGGLLRGLAELPGGPQLAVTAFTWRGAAALHRWAGPGVTVARRRAPARLLQAAWRRWPLPPVEWLCGPVDVFHAPNFVLPPTRRAAGVVTVHDLAFLDHPDTVPAASLRYRALVPRSLRRAAAVCTVTHAVADELIGRFDLDPARVVVTPNGLSPRWLAGPAAVGSAPDGLPDRYLVFVGTLEPRKNVDVLLAAVRRLHAGGADPPPLVLAGPVGWGRPADTTGLPPGAVRRTGWLDEDRLAGVVAGACCLVLPSRDEGFGIPPLEALACGVPAVVSDLPTLREVLGRHARYVPVGDSAALADALADVLAAPADMAGRAAGQRHARTFTWRRCAEAALRAYQIASSRTGR